MIIIDDDYRVDSDDACYTLQERKVSKAGVERWENVAYKKTLAKTLESYREHSHKKRSQAHMGVKIEKWISDIAEQDEAFKTFLETLNIKDEN